MGLVAIFTALAATLIVPSVFSWDDALIGLFSGLGLGLGLLWYFTGLTHSSSAVVAPLVATLSAVIPFLYAVVRGASRCSAHASRWSDSGSSPSAAGCRTTSRRASAGEWHPAWRTASG